MNSYIFVHAAVAKRTFAHLGMHGAVVRRTFVFLWMNPLAGIGVSLARNCSEIQILSSRTAHCTGRFNAHEMKRWMSQLHCVLQFRVAVVCVSYSVLQFRVAVICVVLLCFVIQGCAGLRIPIVFCNSRLRWSAYSHCVLQVRVAVVCVVLLCFAIQGCAGLRILIVFCNSGLRWSA